MPTTPDDALIEVTSVSNPKLKLSPEEGFLVSRAFGRRVSVAELVKLSGMAPDQARRMIETLVSQGVFVVVSSAPAAPRPDDPYAGFIFPAGVLDEPVDLTPDQKKRIVFVDQNIGSWSWYRLLGVKRTASAADIKQGYFRASKEFHPDAFFRRNLGSYKERIDRIFRAMKQAYDVLSDQKRRAAYDENLIGELTPEEEAELERRAADKKKAKEEEERLARHQQRLADQRVKRNPMLERVKKAQELMVLADKAVTERKYAEAERHARLALEYAPLDQELKKRTESIIKWGAQERARSLVARVPKNLTLVDNEALARVADEVAELANGDPGLLVEASKLSAAAGRMVAALKYATEATELAPKSPDAWRVLAETAARDEKWATALRAAERWSAAAPSDAAAKELMKQAKRLAK